MEDGIEKSHQTGKRKRGQFNSVINLQVKAEAMQRVVHRNSDPDVVAETQKVIEASKQKLTGDNDDKESSKEDSRERERNAKRLKALDDYKTGESYSQLMLSTRSLFTDLTEDQTTTNNSTTDTIK